MFDPEGNIINWNMGAQRIRHYKASEILGQNFSRFYTEEEQQQGQPARALQLAAYEGKYVAEGLRVRPDRSLFWANVVIEAIRDEGARRSATPRSHGHRRAAEPHDLAWKSTVGGSYYQP